MDSHEEFNKKVKIITVYLSRGLLALIFGIILILVLRFLVGLLILISMGA